MAKVQDFSLHPLTSIDARRNLCEIQQLKMIDPKIKFGPESRMVTTLFDCIPSEMLKAAMDYAFKNQWCREGEIIRAAYKAKRDTIQARHPSTGDMFKTEVSEKVTIEFDGGTPCNIPARGYGDGYGSYRINMRPIVRKQFHRPMSANAAELFTLHAALEEAASLCNPKATELLIRGDSKIALKWAKCGFHNGKRNEAKIDRKVSPEFIESIQLVAVAIKPFGNVTCEWRDRSHSVRIFGH